jgi:hypothetical protein
VLDRTALSVILLCCTVASADPPTTERYDLRAWLGQCEPARWSNPGLFAAELPYLSSSQLADDEPYVDADELVDALRTAYEQEFENPAHSLILQGGVLTVRAPWFVQLRIKTILATLANRWLRTIQLELFEYAGQPAALAGLLARGVSWSGLHDAGWQRVGHQRIMMRNGRRIARQVGACRSAAARVIFDSDHPKPWPVLSEMSCVSGSVLLLHAAHRLVDDRIRLSWQLNRFAEQEPRERFDTAMTEIEALSLPCLSGVKLGSTILLPSTGLALLASWRYGDQQRLLLVQALPYAAPQPDPPGNRILDLRALAASAPLEQEAPEPVLRTRLDVAEDAAVDVEAALERIRERWDDSDTPGDQHVLTLAGLVWLMHSSDEELARTAMELTALDAARHEPLIVRIRRLEAAGQLGTTWLSQHSSHALDNDTLRQLTELIGTTHGLRETVDLTIATMPGTIAQAATRQQRAVVQLAEDRAQDWRLPEVRVLETGSAFEACALRRQETWHLEFKLAHRIPITIERKVADLGWRKRAYQQIELTDEEAAYDQVVVPAAVRLIPTQGGAWRLDLVAPTR